jgi:hypothetical protein
MGEKREGDAVASTAIGAYPDSLGSGMCALVRILLLSLRSLRATDEVTVFGERGGDYGTRGILN